ncbi:MAG TPA: hypothetical protein DEV81_24065 [Cyanobacteria bacterium UBA11049]|nr:hypothetical protein [Cyanobacteria bacterium UBA11049]
MFVLDFGEGEVVGEALGEVVGDALEEGVAGFVVEVLFAEFLVDFFLVVCFLGLEVVASATCFGFPVVASATCLDFPVAEACCCWFVTCFA